MTRLHRLLVLSFCESFAGMLVQRAIYFFTHDQLAYTRLLNLWLALGMGAVYVAGALPSHRLCQRFGEKRVLRVAIAGQVVAAGLIWLHPYGWGLWVGAMGCQLFHGMMWPVIESYLAAGRTPREASRAVGTFNLTWSGAIPVVLLVAGSLIDTIGPGMFLLAALIHVAMLVVIQPMAAAPAHLPTDHPDRPPPHTLRRYGALMWSSRWALISAYVLMYLIFPLLPDILQNDFGLTVAVATAVAALTDAGRWVTFYVMRHTHRWHGSMTLAVVVLIALPAGAFAVLLGPTLSLVIAGEVLFGIAVGLGYYSALYYAMVTTNASVDAGGAHEGLIGVGFTLGPAAGLVGLALTPTLGPTAAMLTALGPIVLACAAAGVVPLVQPRPAAPTPPTNPPADDLTP